MDRETRTDEPTRALAAAFRDMLGEAPIAFAVTHGPMHILLAGNRAFADLAGGLHHGEAIADVLDAGALRTLLDRSFRSGIPLHDDMVIKEVACNGAVWPLLGADRQVEGLVLELRSPAIYDSTYALQRDIAERLLLGALRERDLAEAADAARDRAAFLAESSSQLAASIDEEKTQHAIAGLHLPRNAEWCIVDVLHASGDYRRLAIVHPDPLKADALRSLEHIWKPRPGDGFGLPAVSDEEDIVMTVDNAADVLARSLHHPDHIETIRNLRIGTLLTVPMAVAGRTLGAITFVGCDPGEAYSGEEIALARSLAQRSALALDSARLYGEASALREKAEAANRVKSEFLGHMSHELRTPLTAIGGYVDIIDMEIHGPVTPSQRHDLERIRSSQQHLLGLINQILGYMQAQGSQPVFSMVDVKLQSIIAGAIPLVEPQLHDKSLDFHVLPCDPALEIHADAERVEQILVNLLANAIKFTERGGSISIECGESASTVSVSIIDTGIGIPPDQVDAIFDPFVQVRRGDSDPQGGVGLGLAISRDLARAMGGNLTAVSVAGEGSTFTLTLSRGWSR